MQNYSFQQQSYQYNAVSNPNLLQHQFQVNQEHTSLPQQMVDDSIQAKHYYSIRSVEDRALRDIQNLNNHQIQNQIKAQRCHTSQSIENSVLQNNLGKISQTILSPNQQFLQNISTHYSQIKKYETFLQDIKKLNSNFYPQNPQVQLVNNQINNQQSKFQDQHVNNSNMNFLLQNQPQERLLDSSSVFVTLKNQNQSQHKHYDSTQIQNSLENSLTSPQLQSGFYSTRNKQPQFQDKLANLNAKYQGFSINLNQCQPFTPRNGINKDFTQIPISNQFQQSPLQSQRSQSSQNVMSSNFNFHNKVHQNFKPVSSMTGFNSHRGDKIIQPMNLISNKTLSNDYLQSQRFFTSNIHNLSKRTSIRRQDNSDIRIVYSQKEENTSKQRIASLDNSQMIQNHCQSQQYGDDLKNKDLLLQISDSRKNKLSIASIKTQEQSNVMINYKYLDLSTIQSETKQLNGKGSYAYNTSQLANLENMPIKASQLTFEQLLDKEMQRESICQNHVFNSSGNNLAEVECNLFDAQSKSLEFEPSQEVPKVDVVNLDESSISSYVRNGTQETNESTQNINSIAPKPFLKRGDGYVTNYVKINVDQTFRNSELRNESVISNKTKSDISQNLKSDRKQDQIQNSRQKSISRNHEISQRLGSELSSKRLLSQKYIYSSQKNTETNKIPQLSNLSQIKGSIAIFNPNQSLKVQNENIKRNSLISKKQDSLKKLNQTHSIKPQKQLNSSRGLYKILENDELVENIKQQEIQKIENEMSKLQKKMKNLLSGRDDKGSSKTLGHYNQTLIKSQQITKPKKVGDKNQQKTNKQVYSENYNQSNLPTLKNQTSISTLQQKNFKGKSSPRVIGKSQGCKDQSKTKNSNLRLTQNNQSISQVDRSDSVMSFESKEQQLQSSKAQKPQPHNTKTQLRHFSVHTKPSEENLIKSLLNIDQKYMLDSKPVKTKTWNEEGVIEIVYQDGTKEQQMVSGMSKRHYQDGTIILTMPNQDVKLIREDGSQVNIYAQKRPEDKSQSEQLTIIRSLYDV